MPRIGVRACERAVDCEFVAVHHTDLRENGWTGLSGEKIHPPFRGGVGWKLERKSTTDL